jgi:AcrR family transcriptional regulator
MTTTRAEQRAATRQRIVDAAVETFAEHGFGASSTRDIAARAGVTQGLVTYHFASKDELWRAAADQIFGLLGGELPEAPKGGGVRARRDAARDAIRTYVRFTAAHPELLHFMVDAGRHSNERMHWLVETHLHARLGHVVSFGIDSSRPTDPAQGAHVYYALAGAASLIFAVAPECRALTGVDPRTPEHVEAHAEFVARLFVP